MKAERHWLNGIAAAGCALALLLCGPSLGAIARADVVVPEVNERGVTADGLRFLEQLQNAAEHDDAGWFIAFSDFPISYNWCPSPGHRKTVSVGKKEMTQHFNRYFTERFRKFIILSKPGDMEGNSHGLFLMTPDQNLQITIGDYLTKDESQEYFRLVVFIDWTNCAKSPQSK